MKEMEFNGIPTDWNISPDNIYLHRNHTCNNCSVVNLNQQAKEYFLAIPDRILKYFISKFYLNE